MAIFNSYVKLAEGRSPQKHHGDIGLQQLCRSDWSTAEEIVLKVIVLAHHFFKDPGPGARQGLFMFIHKSQKWWICRESLYIIPVFFPEEFWSALNPRTDFDRFSGEFVRTCGISWTLLLWQPLASSQWISSPEYGPNTPNKNGPKDVVSSPVKPVSH